MSDNSGKNEVIVKNSLLLYARMLLLLFISLYTSRVILSSLGIIDYGLYNVIGGIVALFSFISHAMGNSTQRFITFSLGKGNLLELNSVFSSSWIIHLLIAVLIFLLAETIGLWFLYDKMVIPEDRFNAAFWVYQSSIFASMVTFSTIPYNSLVIAHEKMGMFAIVSIMDALLKLFAAIVLRSVNYDRLIIYAFFILGIEVIKRSVYQVYCNRNFQESKVSFVLNKEMIKRMSSFAGWSLIGNIAWVSYTQGLNILLNMFFGPVVNAARGIAVQVQNAVKGFVTNIQTAINPQITKSYAECDYERMKLLMFSSSRLSFFFLFIIVLPLCIETKYILSIWLEEIPNYSISFVRLILLITLFDTLSNPIGIANNATGEIRNYQIVEGTLLLLIIPISYFFLKFGFNPNSVFVVQLIVSIFVQSVRVALVKNRLRLSLLEYAKEVIVKIAIVAVASSLVPVLLFLNLPESLGCFAFIVLSSISSVLTVVYFWGLTQGERKFLIEKVLLVKSKIKRI